MALTKDIKMARNIIDGKYSPCDNKWSITFNHGYKF